VYSERGDAPFENIFGGEAWRSRVWLLGVGLLLGCRLVLFQKELIVCVLVCFGRKL
jgi:hypothetical protein